MTRGVSHKCLYETINTKSPRRSRLKRDESAQILVLPQEQAHRPTLEEDVYSTRTRQDIEVIGTREDYKAQQWYFSSMRHR